MSLTVGDIAVRFGCELRGDPDQRVDRVASLQDASGSAIAFLANPAYQNILPETRAAAVILNPQYADSCPTTALVTGNPYLVYAQVAAKLHPAASIRPGVHASAAVGESSRLPDSCEVSAGAVIGADVVLGERVYVGPNAVIQDRSRIGDDTRLLAGAVLHHDVFVGARCIIHAACVIGSDGFGNAQDASGAWVKVPQLGRVVIGDDVEIGANCTIDRGAIGDTRINNGARLDNLIQIAHNVVIGEHTAIAAQVGIAGSTTVGARCMLGGQCGVNGHIAICDDVYLMGGTKVTNSIEKPGVYGGPPNTAEPVSVWRKNAVRYRQLNALARRLRRLEQVVEKQDSHD